MSDDLFPLYQGQDFYVPYFEVVLQRKPLSRMVVRDIIQLSYTDNLKQVDSFSITINNWDAEQRTFSYSDTDLFNPGKLVELWMGYYGRERLRLMTVGKITSLQPSFPAGGQPTLVISGQNSLHQLRDRQETVVYTKLRDSEIAEQIGVRLHVEVRTDASARAREEQREYVRQDNQYALNFLMQLAKRNKYDLIVEESGEHGTAHSVVYFGPPRSNRRTHHLSYGKSLIDFQPRLDMTNQVNAVEIHARDKLNKREQIYTAERSQLEARGIDAAAGRAEIERAIAPRREVIRNYPVNSPQEGQANADGSLDRIVRETVTGRGTTIGLPDLRAGNYVVVEGVGKRFSGLYLVTSTTHTLGGSGYTTTFEGERKQASQ